MRIHLFVALNCLNFSIRIHLYVLHIRDHQYMFDSAPSLPICCPPGESVDASGITILHISIMS